jgi:hypothetical protein
MGRIHSRFIQLRKSRNLLISEPYNILANNNGPRPTAECGRAIRVLSVVDAYRRECLPLAVR